MNKLDKHYRADENRENSNCIIVPCFFFSTGLLLQKGEVAWRLFLEMHEICTYIQNFSFRET